MHPTFLARGSGALNGRFCFGVAMHSNEFFQNEAKHCQDNAKMATSKEDREFWLNMASRWETMQRITKRETPKVEVGTIEYPYFRKRYRAAQ